MKDISIGLKCLSIQFRALTIAYVPWINVAMANFSIGAL